MSSADALQARSASQCELCSAPESLGIYEVPPHASGSAGQCLFLCQTCRDQIENPDSVDVHHWRCLNDSIWSQIPAVQVMAWRMLKRLRAESWARDLLDMLYLDEETLAWAQATGEGENAEEGVTHIDSNGTALTAGDSVTLIKDLNVKGANFTAKRGTIIRNISLVADNAEHIEGRANGQKIVILTKFTKKTN